MAARDRSGIDMDRALTMLRDYAWNLNQRLTDVARDFAEPLPALLKLTKIS